MKRWSMARMISLLAASLLVTAWTPARAQTVWKLQSLVNPGHMAIDAELWLAQEVEKRTGGKLRITVYPGAALGFAGPRILTVVKEGLLEASEMWGAHVAGDLRIAEVIELPGLIPYDIPLRKKVVEAMKPYWEKAMGERFSVIPIAVAQVEPRNIYARKPIKTLADLKGMKIRAQGPVETDFTRAIGATPVTTDWPEVYPALQQGVIDGYWVTHSATFNAKLHEVAKYEWDVGLGGATWYVIVNRAAFNKLPPELQKMVRELGREASEKVWERVDKDIKDFRARLERGGMSFIPAPAEDMKVMVEKSKGLWNDWIQKAGADGKEMVEKIQAIVGQSRAQLK